MSSSPDGGTPSQPGRRPRPVPSLGAAMARIGERFEEHGALGILRLDASPLSTIERRFGEEARLAAAASLGTLLRELCDELLDVDDLVVFGDAGCDEALVLIFREPDSARFYRHELPEIARHVMKELDRRGNQVFYPYLRSLPPMVTGTAAALRNPRFTVETEVARALGEARIDADLNARLAGRARRQQLMELILDRRLYSVYEPIVDVASKTVHGYEALVRGPEGTPFHSPGALFALASEEDLLFELDCVCRATALEGAVDIPHGTKLFLNIRPTTIHDPNFRAERLIRTLESTSLRPSDVIFEISEQESIGSYDAMREIRDYYRNLGFRLALDDTGSGYAGLEALLEISPDYIKVDRSCVSGIDQDPARQTMLRALQTVAQETGARLIAEGLDTLEELEMLSKLGIPYGQGWLFGRPTPLRSKGGRD